MKRVVCLLALLLTLVPATAVWADDGEMQQPTAIHEKIAAQINAWTDWLVSLVEPALASQAPLTSTDPTDPIDDPPADPPPGGSGPSGPNGTDLGTISYPGG